ncbi:MAG: hypothetical protein QNJ73_02950 [Gammaproteobacteria bacterium]|nr:hypothetical protein [Gammaproteobacteria bacterium]
MSEQDIPVIAVVTFPAPADLDADALRALLEEAGPNYINISGLRRKYFLSGDGVGGGVYEWDNRQSADAFYDDAWYAFAREQFGATPEIVFYEAAAIADGVEHRLDIFLPKT